MKYIKVFAAKIEMLDSILDWMEDKLSVNNVDPEKVIELRISVEEVFVNIANYAYPDKEGDATIEMVVDDNVVSMLFKDHGIQYNPLLRDDPDINAELSEREIGGLGIFMVKNMMDNVEYEYKDNCNCLLIEKNI